MMKKPNTIAVNIELKEEVLANRVNLFVDVRGSSFVSGRTALKKAKEVRSIVEGLAQIGVTEENIQLMSVQAEVSSGMLTKSSSAKYSLKILVADLDALADVLGVILEAKNASVNSLEWLYDDYEKVHNAMLEEAIARAERRIAVMCQSLQHEKVAVYTMTENLRTNDHDRYMMPRVASPAAMRAVAEPMTKEDLGLDITHSKTISLEVHIEYHVEPVGAAE